MQQINFHHKKIGIWGFGVVGKSALEFAQNYTSHIQIIDRNFATIPAIAQVQILQETAQNLEKFLEENDFIFPSPGICLHDYEKFAHKFVCELDILAQEFHGSTIAITGTVGKTTITSLLQQSIPDAQAAGNIGYAMLNVLQQKPLPANLVLELSSYQLQYSRFFAPDIAIWSNFYPNHLDHHRDAQEYFVAKCNLLRHQKSDQIALLPLKLATQILNQTQSHAQIFCFTDQPVENINSNYPVFCIAHDNLVLHNKGINTIIFEHISQLPEITFMQNWIVILATLYLKKISLQNFAVFAQGLTPQEHRLEFVRNFEHVAIFNDSKSTVWQATQKAVEKFQSKRIALFLGGMSKGTDRSPLIESLQHKPITVFAFGKEADQLATHCQQSNIAHHVAPTLPQALQQFLTHFKNFDVLLFSPAGSSFDLFKNYQDRGNQFKQLVAQLPNIPS